MKVWDFPTRLYHWLQAGLFVGLAASGFRGEGPHMYLGLGLFTLILWRIVWGFVGSETSRFKQFLRSPKGVLRYLLGRLPVTPGHNPAGGWMVVVMISLLLLQCLSGIVVAGLADNLPLAELWLTDAVFDISVMVHGICARLLPAVVGIHLFAILVYKLRSKPLVWAMVVGVQKKLSVSTGDVAIASNTRALLVLVVAGLVTMAIVALSLM
ncbi:cytochrome b/b6 domain-containing protein [Photobacterium sp. SDRW27]|uniref:cytochrome b/b6 domain-containing protein n=1 Tax=Photobacterium obscurum TaxID=2829490 RepID=UPI0022443C68|nr:cytochrome b/b6 domain-containing protein [Photobacterium obscurum]MCW8330957.1 cytochrome b/b6 domain-containing protein [Photobacterium obscurum]